MLHRQNVLRQVKCVDDVLVTTSNGEERPRVSEHDKRQTVVEYVEQIVILDLFQTRETNTRINPLQGRGVNWLHFAIQV